MKRVEQLKLWEIQPQERIATTCVANPAYRKVTTCMKPGVARYQAVMKVKGLSPEIISVSGVEAVHLAQDNILISDRRQGGKNLTGSETIAWYQKDMIGTRETQSVPLKFGVCGSKSIDDKLSQKTLWESDQLIVAMKQGNACRAKELAVIPWDDRDTSSTLRGGQKKSTKLSSLTVLAQENPKGKFTSLSHLLTLDFLKECFRELKRDKASGVDGVTVKGYEENLKENLADLVERLKAKRYRPKPVRRVYIPKSKGERRPLGIPSVEDKIVQMALNKILTSIFEVDFADVSFGFRPGRNCHQALDTLDKAIMTKPVNWVVDMDILKFFDNVDHKWLMRFLRIRIADPNILRLIGRFLKAGIMEEGKFYQTDKGTPQGGILSPLLANIYLHFILDLWFGKVVKKKLKGFSCLIRYCDDFIVLFQSASEAKAFEEMLKRRLAKFSLKVCKDKSQTIEFGRYAWDRTQREGGKLATFDFLGFTHYCTKTIKGYFKLGRKTSRERFIQKLKGINVWLKYVRNQVELKKWREVLNLKLVGHFRYYGISGNMPQMRAFYKQVVRLLFKWINRRSQKKSYNWTQFLKYLKYNPLPQPKIYHLTYTLSW